MFSTNQGRPEWGRWGRKSGRVGVMEDWSDGVLEWWSDGVVELNLFPLLHYSNTPIFLYFLIVVLTKAT